VRTLKPKKKRFLAEAAGDFPAAVRSTLVRAIKRRFDEQSFTSRPTLKRALLQKIAAFALWLTGESAATSSKDDACPLAAKFKAAEFALDRAG